MPLPRISVFMPVYNTERYVAAAVQSVLEQTFTDFEFIIVDDGSTDRSPEIVEAIARRDSRINFVRRPHGGRVAVLNYGLSLCQADLVASMDSDDITLPGRFQLQIDYLTEHPEILAVGTRLRLMDPEGVAIADQFGMSTHEEIDASNRAGNCAISHGTIMMRRRRHRGHRRLPRRDGRRPRPMGAHGQNRAAGELTEC